MLRLPNADEPRAVAKDALVMLDASSYSMLSLFLKKEGNDLLGSTFFFDGLILLGVNVLL